MLKSYLQQKKIVEKYVKPYETPSRGKKLKKEVSDTDIQRISIPWQNTLEVFLISSWSSILILIFFTTTKHGDLVHEISLFFTPISQQGLEDSEQA